MKKLVSSLLSLLLTASFVACGGGNTASNTPASEPSTNNTPTEEKKEETDWFYSNGDIVGFGKSELKVLSTPGHSQGGVALYSKADNLLFSGDTLFFNSIGRADLPGGDEQQFIESIKNQLLTLPDDTAVLPGHGLQTSIGFERTNNHYLQ